MGNGGNWFTSMFGGETESNDLLKARTLNITKITALLVPIATGVLAALEAFVVDEGPLAGLTPGQRLTIVIALIAFVAVVVATDMLVRGLATAAALRGPVSVLPAGLTGKWIRPSKDLGCSVVATRSGPPGQDSRADLLIFLEDGNNNWPKGSVLWVPGDEVDLT